MMISKAPPPPAAAAIITMLLPLSEADGSADDERLEEAEEKLKVHSPDSFADKVMSPIESICTVN
jgi:hypothetical protein